MVDFRNIIAMAQQQPQSIPGLLAMLRGGDPQGVGGGGGVPQSVASTMAASNAMRGDGGAGAGAGAGGGGGGGTGGGAQEPDQFGWLQGSIAAPPEGWQSQKGIYDQAGFGNGWLMNNSSENPNAYAHTMAGPQMPNGIDPFTDITYAPSTGNDGQLSGFHLVDRRDTGSPGQDLFGGKQFPAGNIPKDIPQQLQPWLAPALMKYFIGQQYHNQGGSGMNAPWTRQYAPAGADIKTWPGITNYDPWGRSQGEIPNYSGG